MVSLTVLIQPSAFAATAHGTDALSIEAQNTLTAIDAVPTPTEIDAQFVDHATALASLSTIAQDNTTDVGIRIRALHALAKYCVAPCADTDTAHQALVARLDGGHAVVRAQGQIDIQRSRCAASGGW